MPRRRKHEEEPENHDRWLVSYADFITLLFAFFTVLYAIAPKDNTREKEIEKSIRKAFETIVDFGGPLGIGENTLKLGLIPPMNPSGEMSNSRNDEAEQKIMELVDPDSKDALKNSLRHDSIGLRMELAAATLFSSGSAKLKPDALVQLNKLGTILKQTSYRVIVEGHTDDIPVSQGEYESNWELAAARASTIVRFLISYHQISPGRLMAVSHADQRPIVPNDNATNRSRNRRIELLIVTGTTPL